MGRALAMAVLLAAGALRAAPGATLVRCEARWLPVDAGLRAQLWLLFGGSAGAAAWRAWDRDGDLELDEHERRAATADLLARVRVAVDGAPRALVCEQAVFPARRAVVASAEPVVLAVRLRGGVPRARAVRCRFVWRGDGTTPVLARHELVTPAAAAVSQVSAAHGALAATLVWPAETGRVPAALPLTVPEWFSTPREQAPPDAQRPLAGPADGPAPRGTPWTAPLVLVAAWGGWRVRRRRGVAADMAKRSA